MAAQTQLSPTATPGRRYAFAAKTGAVAPPSIAWISFALQQRTLTFAMQKRTLSFALQRRAITFALQRRTITFALQKQAVRLWLS